MMFEWTRMTRSIFNSVILTCFLSSLTIVPANAQGSGSNDLVVILFIIAIVLCCILSIIACIFLRRKWRQYQNRRGSQVGRQISQQSSQISPVNGINEKRGSMFMKPGDNMVLGQQANESNSYKRHNGDNLDASIPKHFHTGSVAVNDGHITIHNMSGPNASSNQQHLASIEAVNEWENALLANGNYDPNNPNHPGFNGISQNAGYRIDSNPQQAAFNGYDPWAIQQFMNQAQAQMAAVAASGGYGNGNSNNNSNPTSTSSNNNNNNNNMALNFANINMASLNMNNLGVLPIEMQQAAGLTTSMQNVADFLVNPITADLLDGNNSTTQSGSNGQGTTTTSGGGSANNLNNLHHSLKQQLKAAREINSPTNSGSANKLTHPRNNNSMEVAPGSLMGQNNKEKENNNNSSDNNNNNRGITNSSASDSYSNGMTMSGSPPQYHSSPQSGGGGGSSNNGNNNNNNGRYMNQKHIRPQNAATQSSNSSHYQSQQQQQQQQQTRFTQQQLHQFQSRIAQLHAMGYTLNQQQQFTLMAQIVQQTQQQQQQQQQQHRSHNNNNNAMNNNNNNNNMFVTDANGNIVAVQNGGHLSGMRGGAASHLGLTKSKPMDAKQALFIKDMKEKIELIHINDLALNQEIGRGKFGKVFDAKWDQKRVAVKLFKQDEINEECFDDFKKEIDVASLLPQHDNVLKIFAFTVNPYSIVEEYLNGGSVEIAVSCQHRRSKRHEYSILDIVQMLQHAARGIQHLHTANIVHRDIAARNLLLNEETYQDTVDEKIVHPNNPHKVVVVPRIVQKKKRRVVVCDFGLSRITDSAAKNNYTTSHVGPLKWMSPESIQRQIYNTKTDAYSFGIVIWEVLTGVPPYPDMKVVNVAVEVLYKSTRPCIPQWFPRQLQYLMQRCWQTIPEYRPTFDEIVDELKEFRHTLRKATKNMDPYDPQFPYPLISDPRFPKPTSQLVELPDLRKQYEDILTESQLKAVEKAFERYDSWLQEKERQEARAKRLEQEQRQMQQQHSTTPHSPHSGVHSPHTPMSQHSLHSAHSQHSQSNNPNNNMNMNMNMNMNSSPNLTSNNLSNHITRSGNSNMAGNNASTSTGGNLNMATLSDMSYDTNGNINMTHQASHGSSTYLTFTTNDNVDGSVHTLPVMSADGQHSYRINDNHNKNMTDANHSQGNNQNSNNNNNNNVSDNLPQIVVNMSVNRLNAIDDDNNDNGTMLPQNTSMIIGTPDNHHNLSANNSNSNRMGNNNKLQLINQNSQSISESHSHTRSVDNHGNEFIPITQVSQKFSTISMNVGDNGSNNNGGNNNSNNNHNNNNLIPNNNNNNNNNNGIDQRQSIQLNFSNDATRHMLFAETGVPMHQQFESIDVSSGDSPLMSQNDLRMSQHSQHSQQSQNSDRN